MFLSLSKIKKILFILFTIAPIQVSTQRVSFEYSLGWGEYKLEDVKFMKNKMLHSNDFGLKETAANKAALQITPQNQNKRSQYWNKT